MESLKVIEALDAAIRIIAKQRKSLASGSMTLWRILDHAESYLDEQIRQLMAA